ncbi:MAG: PIN domain-containing protein [Aeromicrobium sp.]|uniref:type II toxin-antitoxin system VapC family toxin n=1 Tax=Aeromicrobium sp. TaxID=1871063 RepID=UPI0039E2FC12
MPFLVPATVSAEAGYLIAKYTDSATGSAFLHAVADGGFELVSLDSVLVRRTADLVAQYADLGLGTADASVVAIAESLNISETAAFDRRHFSVVRPRHIEAFTPSSDPL